MKSNTDEPFFTPFISSASTSSTWHFATCEDLELAYRNVPDKTFKIALAQGVCKCPPSKRAKFNIPW